VRERSPNDRNLGHEPLHAQKQSNETFEPPMPRPKDSYRSCAGRAQVEEIEPPPNKHGNWAPTGMRTCWHTCMGPEPLKTGRSCQSRARELKGTAPFWREKRGGMRDARTRGGRGACPSLESSRTMTHRMLAKAEAESPGQTSPLLCLGARTPSSLLLDSPSIMTNN
jgi:hypothetical protein